jgi:hypothetical protein
MKKKFNFNLPANGLNGLPLQNTDATELHLGQVLAMQLSNQTSGDSIKTYQWALDLYNKQELELDLSDQKTLRDIIISLQLANIVKAQLLMIIGI